MMKAGRAMEELIAIKLKPRNGGSTIVCKEDIETLYLGDIVECMLYKDNVLSRCKKAGKVVIHLKESADKLFGKISVFEKIINESNIYSLELLYQDSTEVFLVPNKSNNCFAPNDLEKHTLEDGLKITITG